MNKRIDLTNLGGFPFTQDTLAFMQDSYRGAFGGLALMAGDKTIIAGVEVSGSNVTDGWIAYQGELIPFIGGVLGADVVIAETAVNADFEDGSNHPAYITKVATSGVGGLFPFSDLVRLQALQNVWLPGDIKEKWCDAAYIAANFDIDGYGVNREKGWRILSKALPQTAGKTFVNIDFADPDFNTVGKQGGEKKHQLTVAELPKHRLRISASANTDNTGVRQRVRVANADGADLDGGYTDFIGGDTPHNNMQPYSVILKLIKHNGK